MAAYPSIDISGVEVRAVNGAVVNVSPSGNIAGHMHFTQINHELMIIHEFMTESDKNTLESFLTTNADADDIAFTYDGDTYTGILYAPPIIRPSLAAIWYGCVYLLGVKT